MSLAKHVFWDTSSPRESPSQLGIYEEIGFSADNRAGYARWETFKLFLKVQELVRR